MCNTAEANFALSSIYRRSSEPSVAIGRHRCDIWWTLYRVLLPKWKFNRIIRSIAIESLKLYTVLRIGDCAAGVFSNHHRERISVTIAAKFVGNIICPASLSNHRWKFGNILVDFQDYRWIKRAGSGTEIQFIRTRVVWIPAKRFCSCFLILHWKALKVCVILFRALIAVTQ